MWPPPRVARDAIWKKSVPVLGFIIIIIRASSYWWHIRGIRPNQEQAMSASYNIFLMMSSPCAEGFMFGTLKHRYLVFICYHRIVGREIDHRLSTMIAASQRQQ
jgi:hypothetical protein